jgi:nitrous oxidase accessory protein
MTRAPLHRLAVGGVVALALLTPLLGGARAQGTGTGTGAASAPATGALHVVAPGDPLPTLAPGDVVTLAPGVHRGPWTVDVPDVTIRGRDATLDGGGHGHALTLLAPRIRVEGLTVTNVGPTADLYEPDAAIAGFGCDGCAVVGLIARDITTGVRIEDSSDVSLSRLHLRGDGRSPGVTVYMSPRLKLEDSTFHGFLDGVYFERADRSSIERVTVTSAVRYGLHAMLSVGLSLRDNVVQDGGLGSVVMYGRQTNLVGNRFEGHRGAMAFGLLLQEERLTLISDNDIRGNALGVLIVAAPGVKLEGNRIDANGVGVLVQRPETETTAITSLRITGNTFTRNAADVAVDDEKAALTLLGNAYDRAPNLDLDGDGVVDVPFIATSAFAARAAQQPDLTLLAHGPGIALWARLEASVPGVRGATFADPAARMVEPFDKPPRAGWGAAIAALALMGWGFGTAIGGRTLVASALQRLPAGGLAHRAAAAPRRSS